MRARLALVWAALVLTLWGAPVSAQVLPSRGSTVRVTTGGEPGLVVGRVERVEVGGFEIVDEGGAAHYLDLSGVRRVEIYETRRNTWQGALIGAGAGLVVGLVASSRDDCEGESLGICETFEGVAETVTTGLLTLVGGGAGAIIGYRIQSDRWVDAPVTQPPGRFALGLRIPLHF